MHGYFILPGDLEAPIVYFVDRLRDGRSFTTRRVTAIQHGNAIFNMSASFHHTEEGVSHQAAMPDVPVMALTATATPTVVEDIARDVRVLLEGSGALAALPPDELSHWNLPKVSSQSAPWQRARIFAKTELDRLVQLLVLNP